MEEALNTLLKVDDVGTCILHFEGKEIFGSTKKKLNIPIDVKGDSYHPDKVNFSQPCVQTRSTMVGAESSKNRITHIEANFAAHVRIALRAIVLC